MQWLKQHTFIIFIILDIRSTKWESLGCNQGVGRAIFLLMDLGENLFPFFFHLLEAVCLPWLMVPSSTTNICNCISDLCFRPHTILFLSAPLSMLPSLILIQLLSSFTDGASGDYIAYMCKIRIIAPCLSQDP